MKKTTEQWFCDRCGVEFKKITRPTVDADIMYTEVGASQTVKKMEFCQDCGNMLLDWAIKGRMEALPELPPELPPEEQEPSHEEPV